MHWSWRLIRKELAYALFRTPVALNQSGASKARRRRAARSISPSTRRWRTTHRSPASTRNTPATTSTGDHFYIDLVFYHAILKCYGVFDLKTGKLAHQDLGQLQLYVNYYDRERRTEGDNPTLGLILCADKNDAVVRHTLGPDQQRKVFAGRYKLHLPSVAELRAELRRGVRALAAPSRPRSAPASGR